MDAQSIMDKFLSGRGTMPAQVQYGAVISDISIHRVSRRGLAFTGKIIPHLDATVTVWKDDLNAKGIIRSRSEGKASLTFVRPAMHG